MDFSTPPYLLKNASVSRVMTQVLLALVPAIALYAWLIGPAILIQIGIATVVALLGEAIMLKVRNKPLDLYLGDGSAIVTAWLIALVFPPLAPWWLVVVGTLFAIVIAKHLYGGLGQNPFNPAMIAFAVCIVSFPSLMSQWPNPGLHLGFGEQFRLIFGMLPRIDGMSSATALDALKTGLKLAEGGSSVGELFANKDIFGQFAGRGWEWIALAYLIGGLWINSIPGLRFDGTLAVAGVKLHALATWWDALEAAQKGKYFDERGLAETSAFLEAPEQWSANHGGRPPAPRLTAR